MHTSAILIGHAKKKVSYVNHFSHQIKWRPKNVITNAKYTNFSNGKTPTEEYMVSMLVIHTNLARSKDQSHIHFHIIHAAHSFILCMTLHPSS